MTDVASQPTPIQTIYEKYRSNKLFVNRRYQRKLVWTLEEKQKFIDSILKRYPTPIILVAEREVSGEFEIIDGLQRLHAIVSFIENYFTDIDGNYFNVDDFRTAKLMAEKKHFTPQKNGPFLDPSQASALQNYSLTLSVMRGATQDQIDDVFSRINTYGHRLSDQERRQAGVQSEFANLVRDIACTIRGDVSQEIVSLNDMPSISVDLPRSKVGYGVEASDIFWVRHGILQSTQLRDSFDEELVADICACLVLKDYIPREKIVRDRLYDFQAAEFSEINSALQVYTPKKLHDEFVYCTSLIDDVCNRYAAQKLRDIIFKKKTTNPFPSVFASIFLAFHELIVRDVKVLADHSKFVKSLENITERIDTSRGSTKEPERKKNVSVIKSLIQDSFIPSKSRSKEIYQNHSSIGIEALIRRSLVELPYFDFKQGIYTLNEKRVVDIGALQKIVNTICAMANIGPKSRGKIIIGVADKTTHAERVSKFDNISPKEVNGRYVVGIKRELSIAHISLENYLTKIRDFLSNSGLSEPLKSDVLSSIDYNDFYGMGVVIITVRAQKTLSYVGEYTYWREGDSTKKVESQKQAVALSQRFST